MIQVLRTLNEWVIRSDQEKDSKAIEELAEASYAYLIVQILWFLDPDMAIWKVRSGIHVSFFLTHGLSEGSRDLWILLFSLARGDFFGFSRQVC